MSPEELPIRPPEEDESDRRIEEDEEVVLYETESRHLPFVAGEENHPQRDRYGSHGSGCGSSEEDDREVAQHLQEVGVDVEEPKRQGVDHDGCKEGGRAKHDHAEITKQACFAE